MSNQNLTAALEHFTRHKLIINDSRPRPIPSVSFPGFDPFRQKERRLLRS
jgi:hypothetical protein